MKESEMQMFEELALAVIAVDKKVKGLEQTLIESITISTQLAQSVKWLIKEIVSPDPYA